MSKQDKPSKWEKFSKEETGQEQELDESGVSESADQPEELEFLSRQKLEDELTAMERRENDSKDAALRAQAELENVRRRSERDIANAHRYGNEKILMDLLPVVDGLIHGLESPESKDPHAQGMREGLGLTLDLLQKTLEKHGVTIISPAVGEPFDPRVHEALITQKDPNVKPNTILSLVQKGYQLNGRVLRAARVIVAAE